MFGKSSKGICGLVVAQPRFTAMIFRGMKTLACQTLRPYSNEDQRPRFSPRFLMQGFDLNLNLYTTRGAEEFENNAPFGFPF